jgi:hypothetical protein
MKFVGGLLLCVFSFLSIIVKDGPPEYEEIKLFSQISAWSNTAGHKWDIDEVTAALQLQDRIEIIEGELKGLNGFIIGKHNDVVQVQFYCNGDISLSNKHLLDVPVHQVHKLFKIRG